MPFRHIPINIDYTGRGDDILSRFVLPVLTESIEYDRVTSFFTTESLVAIAEGLNELWQRRGKMRLVLGIHDVPKDLIEAVKMSEDPASELIGLVRQRIIAGLANIHDELAANRLSTIAWMIKDGLLSVRVAITKTFSSNPPGIFHNKVLIFKDTDGDVVAAVGSPNETGAGLGSNFEHLTVFTSWEQERYTSAQINFFERIWNNEEPELTIRALDSNFADEILKTLPKKFISPPSPFPEKQNELRKVIDIALQMPPLAMVSGEHTALYPHQELAFLDALSRHPVRVMLADEVGLGKTFEAGATINYLVKYTNVERVMILAPKAVVYQWQAELDEHFGLNAWVYDAARRAFVSSKNEVRVLGHAEPIIGRSTPQIVIISIQLARGTRAGGHIFANAEVMPNLLVVDEAHSARVKPDLSGDMHPTLIWRMLNDIVRKVPHVLFLTATPMQVHWREYHALLELLGLPKEWSEPENYHRSLNLVARSEPPPLADTALVAKLIRSSLLEYCPQDIGLSDDELALAEELTGSELNQWTIPIRVREEWTTAKDLLVKTHPARFLTIRNTRTALKEIGYSFPERNLPNIALNVPDQIRQFYQQIEDYLTNIYFNVEKALFPSRRFSVGFVKCAYQQRLASSLSSCQLSLLRRRQRVLSIENNITQTQRFGLDTIEFEDTELFDQEELPEVPARPEDNINLEMVAQCASIERSYIDDLINFLDRILSKSSDPKMSKTIDLIQQHLGIGDKVLVFSRYTDTLDAVIHTFRQVNRNSSYPFAVYTGQSSDIDLGSGLKRSTRKEIRQALDHGAIRVVFCSDAASEGLNLQAARVIINIDVPWNPARLEQRIGRIARLGQKATSVDIYNLWYPESVEARMYTRLMQRRDLFELAVGEFPEVVGSAIREQLLQSFGENPFARDPIAELNELKNDIQVQALRRLWDRKRPEVTLTDKFREELAALAISAARSAGATITKVNEYRYRISDNDSIVSFSLKPGQEDVISLRHDALKWLVTMPIVNDDQMNIMLSDSGPFAFAKENCMIDPTTLSGLIAQLVGKEKLPLDLTEFKILEFNEDETISSPWIPSVDKITVPIDLECSVDEPNSLVVGRMHFQPLSSREVNKFC